MRIQLTTEQRARLAQSLPAGYSLDELRIVTGSAQIVNSEALDPVEQTLIAKVTETAGPPKITEGKPTILRTVAWMVHEGANQNREGFVKEELQAITPALFQAPNFGVMDFNHSAVLPEFLSDGHPKVLGVWYKAEFAFDPSAKGGQGAWGILATGMMFAWAFPDHANQMLGEQQRSGKISFSMACIPSTVEIAEDEKGSWAVLHNPVFFTLSALNVPPADADALGVATEVPVISDEALRSRVAQWTDIPSWLAQTREVVVVAAKQGESMEILEQLKTEVTQAKAKIAEFEAAIGTKDALVAEKQAKIAELETKVAGLETKITELETSRGSLVVELEAATTKVTEQTTASAARIAELEAQLKAANDKLAAFESATAVKVKADRLATRIAALPESFRSIHNKKADAVRGRVEAKWADMEDAVWAEYVTDELLGYTAAKVGFVARSQAEGAVAAGELDQESPATIAAKHIKR